MLWLSLLLLSMLLYLHISYFCTYIDLTTCLLQQKWNFNQFLRINVVQMSYGDEFIIAQLLRSMFIKHFNCTKCIGTLQWHGVTRIKWFWKNNPYFTHARRNRNINKVTCRQSKTNAKVIVSNITRSYCYKLTVVSYVV